MEIGKLSIKILATFNLQKQIPMLKKGSLLNKYFREKGQEKCLEENLTHKRLSKPCQTGCLMWEQYFRFALLLSLANYNLKVKRLIHINKLPFTLHLIQNVIVLIWNSPIYENSQVIHIQSNESLLVWILLLCNG